ncbi:hypothetical protein [uncultured Bacteroides sp.]|uniref:hypothetical protein n=1 Tax=uncultured Bacteroides sp. TaxID=162156 RepID=UPI002AA72414|nr:hypothetical protein [uncultured Bacteroides sp.]
MIVRTKFMHLGLFIVALSGFTVATMLLWNWLLPNLLGLQTISFWQALGLLILSRLLFGWGRGMSFFHHHRGMRSKWAKMTPEERREFSQKIRHHKHFWDDSYQEEKGANSSI